MFSICSAMALASDAPTQIGSTRWPSRSRRRMIGRFVMGSTISLIVISICMPDVPENRYKLGTRSNGVKEANGLALQAVGVRGRDPDRNEGADPFGPPREIHHGVAAGSS